MSTSQFSAQDRRSTLIAEIEQIPNDRIPEQLKITRLLRQSATVDRASKNAWNEAIEKIDRAERESKNEENIQQLFQEWTELDEEQEQKETLKIIESLEGVSILEFR
jgi:hypothetical protein